MKKHMFPIILLASLIFSVGASIWASERKASAIDRLTAEVATLNALIGD